MLETQIQVIIDKSCDGKSKARVRKIVLDSEAEHRLQSREILSDSGEWVDMLPHGEFPLASVLEIRTRNIRPEVKE